MSSPFLGEIRIFAGTFAPTSWAHCDGQLLSVKQNESLFGLLGTTYGGDGRTTFGLPELRGRIPIHQGDGPGLSPRIIGQKNGSETQALAINTMPSHSHAFLGTSADQTSSLPTSHVLAANSDLQPYDPASPNTFLNKSSVTTSTGPNAAHLNMMPFQVLNYIIALKGLYPSRS